MTQSPPSSSSAPDSGTPPVAGRAEPIIRIEHLRCAYGSKVVLDDVNLEVHPGEILFLAGGSGSGKSTVLKHIIGLQPPAAGRIVVDGIDVAEAQGEQKQRLLRTFGVSYQSGALFGSMTVLDNIRLPLQEFTDLPADAIREIAMSKLRLVSLGEAAEKMPSELSGGMQKRVAIARAMALDPRIIFLDEPSAGLDPITAAELDELIRSLRGMLGTTAVIVSHELPSIFSIGDRAALFDGARKRMVALGPPAELRDHVEDDFVRAFFNREPRTMTTGAKP